MWVEETRHQLLVRPRHQLLQKHNQEKSCLYFIFVFISFFFFSFLLFRDCYYYTLLPLRYKDPVVLIVAFMLLTWSFPFQQTCGNHIVIKLNSFHNQSQNSLPGSKPSPWINLVNPNQHFKIFVWKVRNVVVLKTLLKKSNTI